jgi:tetratricopeptide (TPR) repeat protein
VSLIYSALSRLEKKSNLRSTSAKSHLSAEYYSLAMQQRGMPLWVKLMLVLALLGVILGFVLAKSLPNFSAEQTKLHENKTEIATLAADASTSNSVNSANSAIAPTSSMIEATPKAIAVNEIISSPQFAEEKKQSSKLREEQRSVQPLDLPSQPSLPLPVKQNEDLKVAAHNMLTAHEMTQEKNSVLGVENTKESNKESNKVEQTKPKAKPELVSKIEFTVESKAVNGDKTMPTSSTKKSELKSTKKQTNAQALAAANASSKTTNTGLSQEEIQGMVKSFKSLIQSGKRAEAYEILDVMKRNLAPESLTLLNLRAWGELKMGDQNLALTLYQQIVERSPDDESAAINLAVLYWKKGMQAEAKKTIEAISEVYPNSNVVQQYSRQFGVQR